jgi:hypothetical protein
LRAAIRVVDAAGRRLAALDRGVERGQRQADIDRAADRIATALRDQASRMTAA